MDPEEEARLAAEAEAAAAGGAPPPGGDQPQLDADGNPIAPAGPPAGGDQPQLDADGNPIAPAPGGAPLAAQPSGMEAQLAKLLTGKSAQEVDRILRIAEMGAGDDKVLKAAQMLMSKKDLKAYALESAKDYEADMDAPARMLAKWEHDNAEMIEKRGYTQPEILEKFNKAMSAKFDGWDPSAENGGLEGADLKDYLSEDKEALAFLKERQGGILSTLMPDEEEEEDAPDPGALEAIQQSRTKTLDEFKGYELDLGDGAKYSFGIDKTPKFRELAGEIAKNPKHAYESRYVQPGADGKEEEYDFGSHTSDTFKLSHFDDIVHDAIEYGKLLGSGMSHAQIAIQMGTAKGSADDKGKNEEFKPGDMRRVLQKENA